jgi:hypothetical protein
MESTNCLHYLTNIQEQRVACYVNSMGSHKLDQPYSSTTSKHHNIVQVSLTKSHGYQLHLPIYLRHSSVYGNSVSTKLDNTGRHQNCHDHKPSQYQRI